LLFANPLIYSGTDPLFHFTDLTPTSRTELGSLYLGIAPAVPGRDAIVIDLRRRGALSLC
jgi:hypothetical protein